MLRITPRAGQARRRPADGRRRAHGLDDRRLRPAAARCSRFAWPAILGAVEAREKALEASSPRPSGTAPSRRGCSPSTGSSLADAKTQAHAIVTERAWWRRRSGRWRSSGPSGAGRDAGPGAARDRRRAGARGGGAPARGGGPLARGGGQADRRAARQRDRPEAGARLPRHAWTRSIELGHHRPQLRRGAVRARRAERADEAVRRSDRRRGRRGRDDARGADGADVAPGAEGREARLLAGALAARRGSSSSSFRRW